MNKNNAGFWLILVIFCFVGFISWKVYFKNYLKNETWSIHSFPATVGDWASEEIRVSDDDKALLETDNVFVRRYTNPAGEEVFLFVVYSQDNRKVSHPPEICYTGAGATILNKTSDSFPASVKGGKINVKRLMVEKGDVRQVFVYWFKVGGGFTANYWKQQALIAWNSILGRPASSALIRISSTVYQDEVDQSARIVKSFGKLIVPSLMQYLP